MLIKFAADNNWEMLPTLMQKRKKEKKEKEKKIKGKIDWVDVCSELEENKKEMTNMTEENKRIKNPIHKSMKRMH